MLRLLQNTNKFFLNNFNKISILNYSTIGPNTKSNNLDNFDINRIETDLNNYFTYYRTQVAQRPFIYRPDNKQILLNMKLRDPITNKLITKTRNFPGDISNKLLLQYMNYHKDDMVKIIQLWKNWLQISKRRKAIWNYFNSNHVSDLLLYSYRYESMFKNEINDKELEGKENYPLSYVISFLYSQRNNFKATGNTKIYDIENFYNIIQLLNIQRHLKLKFNDPSVSQSKILNCWKNVTHRVDKTGLAKILTDCLIQLQKIDKGSLLEDMFGYKYMKATLCLPTLPSTTEKNIKSVLEDNRNTFLIVKTLSLHCADLLESEVLTQFQNFINQYESMQQTDAYRFYFDN